MVGLENIMAFFKHTQTKGHKLYDLYKMYCYSSYPPISQEQFENVVVFMDKWVIRDLKEKAGKCDDYTKFIKKEGLITKKLWNHLKGVKKPLKIVRPISSIEAVEQAIKDGATYSADITARTGLAPRTIRKKLVLLKRSNKIRTEGGGPTRRFFSVSTTPRAVETPAAYADIVQSPKSEAPEPPPTQHIGTDYKSLLPINWDAMTRGDRVDYVQKIQHKGLYNYVLSIDSTLKPFLDVVKKNKTPPINLYVNLFSFSSSSTSEEAKALVKGLVEALNMMGRARLQYVEVKDPPLIEIREVRK
jgi:hypothetical protein